MSEHNNMMLFAASCDAFPSNTNLKIALLKLNLHKHLIKTDCSNYNHSINTSPMQTGPLASHDTSHLPLLQDSTSKLYL